MTLLLTLLLACGDKGGDDTGPGNSNDDTGTPDNDGGGTDGGGTDGGGTDGGGSDGGGSDGGTEPPPDPVLVGVAGTGLVLDPLRGGPLSFTATVEPSTFAVLLDATVVDDAGAVVAVLADDLAPAPDALDATLAALTVEWDGRGTDGAPAAPGVYTVAWTLHDGAGLTWGADGTDAFVVRTGLVGGTWGQSKLEDDERVPLLWHKALGASPYWSDAGTTAAFQLDGVSTGEGVKEVPVDVPEPWADLEVPPEGWTGVNLPQGFSWDSRPTLTLTLGGDLGASAKAVTWGASIEGWELIDGSVAGGTLVFRKAEALTDSLGVREGSLSLVLTADEQPVATQEVPYRIYALMGPATFTSDVSPHLAWVAAVDQALRGIDGVEPTDAAVLDALIEWIFTESDVAYDTRSGASYYMSYSGGWTGGRFDFRGFLDRSSGRIVNCSDCSGIAGVFANMLGVGLDYSIILSNFELNEIKAIGIDEYTSCPFGPGGCGFSYHAVTTNDLSETIWDATLALDGDKDPGSEPWTELLVQSIPGAEYLERLVRSGRAEYYYDDSRVRIQ